MQKYNFEIIHKFKMINLDVDRLSQNPCTSQENSIGSRWHNEIKDEMLSCYHVATFFCLLGRDVGTNNHMTSCCNQRDYV